MRKCIEVKGKSNVMGNVRSLLERSRDFEEAHCSCRELMEDQLQKIESYTTKWMLVGFIILNKNLRFLSKSINNTNGGNN